jgi:hypothetical protein
MAKDSRIKFLSKTDTKKDHENVSAHPGTYTSVILEEGEGRSKQEEIEISSSETITLWRGDAPPATEDGKEGQGREGGKKNGTSYFDRLWDHGQKKRRWFLFLKRN